eukprot:TRINITY_DN1415_c0_g2_i3.p1 TRINITY_DN1415_c0_g2~~TRINITY_DN1415_c0_g2_i3.p1  ORF type:complete len:142 (-),score=13.89 TRINITY_DN1415_c0_g2_i3:165-590(-)
MCIRDRKSGNWYEGSYRSYDHYSRSTGSRNKWNEYSNPFGNQDYDYYQNPRQKNKKEYTQYEYYQEYPNVGKFAGGFFDVAFKDFEEFMQKFNRHFQTNENKLKSVIWQIGVGLYVFFLLKMLFVKEKSPPRIDPRKRKHE